MEKITEIFVNWYYIKNGPIILGLLKMLKNGLEVSNQELLENNKFAFQCI